MEHPLHSYGRVKHLTKFRTVAALNLLFLLYFFCYRLCQPPQRDPNILWRIAVSCEALFAIGWVADCVCIWFQIERQVYLERLLSREKLSSELPNIDVFVTAADPWKEPPFVVANTVVSVLAAEYVPNKLTCYVSDDGGSPFTFFAVLQAHEFARKWIPFCERYRLEPRAPAAYFCLPLNDNHPDLCFTRERNEMQREYEGFKSNLITAMRTQKLPEEVQNLFDELSCGSARVAIDPTDHPGMFKVMEDESLPMLIYLSREKSPTVKHHYKAGALNALLRASGAVSNGEFVVNLDCDMYINDSQALLQAMCFYMDTTPSNKNQLIGFIQFPQHFSNADGANNHSFLFDVICKGLDGVQGPFCVGTGCVMRREALYGYKPHVQEDTKFMDSKLEGLHNQRSKMSLETYGRKFTASSALVASAVHSYCSGIPSYQLRRWPYEEVLHLISCTYEADTEWGKEVGWMYGTSTEDVMTGMKVHFMGWRSIYFSPNRPAFVGSIPTYFPNIIKQYKRWAMGMLEILFNKKCPLYHRGQLMSLQWLIYIYYCVYHLYSIPIFLYTILPTFSLLTGKCLIPKVLDTTTIQLIAIIFSTKFLDYLQRRWIGITAKDWWNNLIMRNMFTLTSSLGASFEIMAKFVMGISDESTFFVTPKLLEDGIEIMDLVFDESWMFMAPIVVVLMNVVGLVMGAMLIFVLRIRGYWLGEVVICYGILLNLFPIVNGLMKGEKNGGVLKILILKSLLIVSILLILPLMYILL